MDSLLYPGLASRNGPGSGIQPGIRVQCDPIIARGLYLYYVVGWQASFASLAKKANQKWKNFFLAQKGAGLHFFLLPDFWGTTV